MVWRFIEGVIYHEVPEEEVVIGLRDKQHLRALDAGGWVTKTSYKKMSRDIGFLFLFYLK